MMIRKAYESRLLSQDGTVDQDQVQLHIGELLNAQIERNRFHVNRKLEGVPSEGMLGRIYQIFEGTQIQIREWIVQMASPLPASAPRDISWTDENIRIQSFYSYLRDDPKTNFAFEMCEGFRMAAKFQIQKNSRKVSPSLRNVVEMEAILLVREHIGRIVFAADRYPKEFKKEIEFEGLEKVDIVELFVKEQLNKVSKRMKRLDLAEQYSLEGSNSLYSIELPKEIARLLLNTRGQLNLGMIGVIKKQFFPEGFTLSEAQQGIVFVLDQMDTSWQKAINAIEVPANSEIASNAMIRADLGILPEEKITKLHCQQAVLGALLSQLSHRPAGDHLALAWAMKTHDAFLMNCLADYTALVRNGCLTRTVRGVPESFFFENKMATELLFSQITVSSKGIVSEFNDTPFWKIPHLISACRQMRITDLEGVRNDILHPIFGSNGKEKNLTWNELIGVCAKYAAGLRQDDEALCAAGKYGFGSSSNHLLKAWENALAGISEAQRGDYVRDNVTHCVLNALKPIFETQEKMGSPYKIALIKEVKAVFHQVLNDSFRLVYNEAISHENNGFSRGYELYQRDVEDLTRKGVRIAKPEEFRALILGALEQTLKQEYASVPSKKDRAVIASLSQALQLCASGPDFMKTVLYAFDEKNREERDPVSHYEGLLRTPMISLAGDNPWEGMVVETGMDFTPDIRMIRPDAPEDLLKWLLGLAKWARATECEPREIVSGFTIEGVEFGSFLSSDLSADVWIKKALLESGMKISKAEMDGGSKLLFRQNLQRWLSDQFHDAIPEKSAQEMEALFSTLHFRVMTVQQYAQRSMDGIFSIFNLSDHQKSVLDGLFLQSLSAAQLREIQKGAVPIASKNRDGASETGCICCFFNPRTEKLDFGSIAEDKTGLQPMDPFEWVEMMGS